MNSCQWTYAKLQKDMPKLCWYFAVYLLLLIPTNYYCYYYCYYSPPYPYYNHYLLAYYLLISYPNVSRGAGNKQIKLATVCLFFHAHFRLRPMAREIRESNGKKMKRSTNTFQLTFYSLVEIELDFVDLISIINIYPVPLALLVNLTIVIIIIIISSTVSNVQGEGKAKKKERYNIESDFDEINTDMNMLKSFPFTWSTFVEFVTPHLLLLCLQQINQRTTTATAIKSIN